MPFSVSRRTGMSLREFIIHHFIIHKLLETEPLDYPFIILCAYV